MRAIIIHRNDLVDPDGAERTEQDLIKIATAYGVPEVDTEVQDWSGTSGHATGPATGSAAEALCERVLSGEIKAVIAADPTWISWEGRVSRSLIEAMVSMNCALLTPLGFFNLTTILIHAHIMRVAAAVEAEASTRGRRA